MSATQSNMAIDTDVLSAGSRWPTVRRSFLRWMTMYPKAFVLAMLSFLVLPGWASETPLSGTFSNVKNTQTFGYAASMKNKINLVVTVGQGGQQFFIQCFMGEKPGFGVTTVFKTPQREAKIKAGPECPAREVAIQLDYEEAFVRIGSGFVYLPRGNIYVPIEP